jgi:uncharacterized protein involved in oxidation of intracellular sulfur
VEVFLIGEAVHWAQIGMAKGILSSTGDYMKDFLDLLVARQNKIHVCKA